MDRNDLASCGTEAPLDFAAIARELPLMSSIEVHPFPDRLLELAYDIMLQYLPVTTSKESGVMLPARSMLPVPM